MSEILEIKPTRMELLKLVRRMELAEKGHRLLKEKLDALIGELLKEARNIKEKQKEVEACLKQAFKLLTQAQAEVGYRELQTLAWILGAGLKISWSSRNIMGVEVPEIRLAEEWLPYPERGTCPAGISIMVEETIRSFRQAVIATISLAEIEERLRRLASEVEKTRRRVNALEFIIIPRMKATIKYIRMRLDEYAREDFIRMKRVKAILREKKTLG